MLLTKNPKHLLWCCGKRKDKDINVDVGIFLLFNASQENFPMVNFLEEKQISCCRMN